MISLLEKLHCGSVLSGAAYFMPCEYMPVTVTKVLIEYFFLMVTGTNAWSISARSA